MPFPFPMDVESPARAPPPYPRLPNTASSGLGLPAWPPVASPSHDHERKRLHQRQSYDDDSVNALSFGFLATAILVSMFLIMAVFERLLRPAEHPRVDPRGDIEGGKPSCFASPKVTSWSDSSTVAVPAESI